MSTFKDSLGVEIRVPTREHQSDDSGDELLMPPPSKRLKTMEVHDAGDETDLLWFHLGTAMRQNFKEQDLDTIPVPLLTSELPAITSRGMQSPDKELLLVHPPQQVSISSGGYKHKRKPSPFKIYEDTVDMELTFPFVNLDGYSSSDDKENVSHEAEDLESGLHEGTAVHARASWEIPNLVVRQPRVHRGPPSVETFRVGETRMEANSDDGDTSTVDLDSDEETELGEEAAHSFLTGTSLNTNDLTMMYYNGSPMHELDRHLDGRL